MNRRLLPALAVFALAVSGCSAIGDRHEVVRHADTEGIYVDVGALDYQVQLSRQLNPRMLPDDAYLMGLPEPVNQTTEDETFFGVFLRVQNQTDEAHLSADDFEIEDTTGQTFRPIPVSDNPLAYRPRTLAPGSVFPGADSAAGDSPTQGAFLLFKMPYSSLGNRPLELRIMDEGDVGVIELDV